MRILVMLTICSLGTPAWGSNVSLVLQLRAYEEAASHDSISALSSNPIGDLLEIMSDATLTPPIRKRATEALAHFGAYEELLAASAHGYPEVRRGAAWAIARHRATLAPHDHDGLEALLVLRPMLNDSNEDVRVSVARAISEVGSKEARAALVIRTRDEPSARVKNTITHLLSR